MKVTNRIPIQDEKYNDDIRKQVKSNQELQKSQDKLSTLYRAGTNQLSGGTMPIPVTADFVLTTLYYQMSIRDGWFNVNIDLDGYTLVFAELGQNMTNYAITQALAMPEVIIRKGQQFNVTVVNNTGSPDNTVNVSILGRRV